MLQNRVDPFGHLIRTEARGLWMGNRGLIHNDVKEIIRPYKLQAWITCKLHFRGRKRKVMSPGLYTELFFLDEATSFAAGHRPCFECRREDAVKFRRLWLKGNPGYKFDEKTPIKKIDEVLHRERITGVNLKVTYKEKRASIPNGVFILHDGKAHLVFDNKIFLWSPFGYEQGHVLPGKSELTVLTPRSVVNTFREGYFPQVALV
jgi:hypothetical protein